MEVGTTSISLTEENNWKIGDEIVIASTDFDHRHAERRIIKNIENNGKDISFDDPLKFKHYSAVESYNGK